MRREFVELARCPVCHAEGELDLEVASEDRHEVREGSVRCRRCGASRGIEGGIVDLMPDSKPDFVEREAAGLELFTKEMRHKGWGREEILSLPHREEGYWFAQLRAIQQTFANRKLDFQPGERVLDVGSNTCWASAMFAERQLEAVALDITDIELQGLATGDWWFEGKGVYFERVLGLMFDVPLASEAFDYVWCCQVLHHNHRENLWRTMRELYRVLKPGGRVIVVNEPVRSLRTPELRPGREVEHYGGHEHVYMRRSYVRATRDAGFAVELVGPWIHPTFVGAPFSITAENTIFEGFRAAARHAVRRSTLASRARLAWKNYVSGTSTYLIGTKPT
jgi:SAM-dependent methyltransferase/uncharacterized protein YbaR (Trm112 family)